MQNRIVFEWLVADAEARGMTVQSRDNPHGFEARLSCPEGEATLRYYGRNDTLDVQPGPTGRDLKPRLDLQGEEFSRAVHETLEQALALLGPGVLEFLERQDRAFALCSVSLLRGELVLPDYSALVMPMAKCLEAYVVKLLVRLNLANAAEVQRPEWNFGQVWNNAQYQAFTKANKEDERHLERIRRQLPFARHASMHSRPGLSSRIGTREAARGKIMEIANIMRESFERFRNRI